MSPEGQPSGPAEELRRRQRIERDQALPWSQRPRRTVWQSVPSTKLVMALLAFPYISLGTLVYWAVRGWRPGEVQDEDLPFLIVLSVVAVVESIAFAMWLRRPRQATAGCARGGMPNAQHGPLLASRELPRVLG